MTGPAGPAPAGGVPAEAARLVAEVTTDGGQVVVLTGAGVSAASGIPTFRGPEGYWTVGSRVYQPQELATATMFARDPEAVWGWYRYRLGVCRAAEPNAAHRALADGERALGDRFTLITQNVDGLHLRAGSTPAHCYRVHGDLEQVRCAGACAATLRPVPDGLASRERDTPLTDRHRAALTCPDCGGWLRPHVLWFDETYDERWFRFESSLRAAERADLLITVGTSGATTLPALVVRTAVGAGAALVDVNPEPNPFADLAAGLDRGAVVTQAADEAVPALVAVL